jgi:putative spermidine/putrescine transport system permease protein
MALPAYASPLQRAWHWAFLAICALGFLFLILPILAIIPISFSAGEWLTYPLPGLSLRWYEAFLSSRAWTRSLQNSLIIGTAAMLLATTLGTVAALGLAWSRFPLKRLVLAVLISPMIVPIVITAVAVYFFYVRVGLANSYLGMILAHTVLAAPFVVITVSAALQGFDRTLIRAAANLGAPPVTVFFKVTMPLILPGVVSGALFAFATSFDEVVVALFLAGPEQRTLPRQMFSGIRENISPTITAAATVLIVISVFLMTTVELLRRRAARLRGVPD